MKMTMPESAPPSIDPNVTLKNMPENLTPVTTPMTSLAWPCVDSPRLPMVKHEIVNRMKDSHEIKMTHAGEHTSDNRPECDTEEYAGEFDFGVNTNDVPHMAVC